MEILDQYCDNILKLNKRKSSYSVKQGKPLLFFQQETKNLFDILYYNIVIFKEWFFNLPIKIQNEFLLLDKSVLMNIEITRFNYLLFDILFVNIPNNGTDNILYKKYKLLQKWIPRSNWLIIEKSGSIKTISGLNKFFKLKAKNPFNKDNIFFNADISLKQDGEFLLISPIIINGEQNIFISTKTEHVLYNKVNFNQTNINVSLIDNNFFNLQEGVITFHNYYVNHKTELKYFENKTMSYFFELLNWRRICPCHIKPGQLKLIPLLKRSYLNNKLQESDFGRNAISFEIKDLKQIKRKQIKISANIDNFLKTLVLQFQNVEPYPIEGIVGIINNNFIKYKTDVYVLTKLFKESIYKSKPISYIFSGSYKSKSEIQKILLEQYFNEFKIFLTELDENINEIISFNENSFGIGTMLNLFEDITKNNILLILS